MPYYMKQVSRKQKAINYEITKIKKGLPKICSFCGRPANDLSHIIPRSLFPQYQTNPDNMQILCRECHNLYDDFRQFRSRHSDLKAQAIQMVLKSDRTDNQKKDDVLSINRYFDV